MFLSYFDRIILYEEGGDWENGLEFHHGQENDRARNLSWVTSGEVCVFLIA